MSEAKPRSIARELVEFQPDAIEIEKRSIPGRARWTLYTVIALIVAVVAWSIWAKVDRIVVAQGQLITTVQPVTIQAASQAPIRSIHVKFGDNVVAGDLLATLDPTFSAADLIKLEIRDNALAASIARLRAERNQIEFSIEGHEDDSDWLLEKQVYDDRREEYAAKEKEFEADIRKQKAKEENNKKEIVNLRDQLEIHEKLEEKITTLVKKESESLLGLWNRQLQRNQAQRALDAAESQKRELAEEIASLKTKRDAFFAAWNSQLSGELLKAERERGELSEELTKARRLNDYVELRVPTDLPYKEFVVLELADRSVGSVLKPSEPLVKLMPINVPLEAEVFVKAKDIGKVTDLREARIKLGAFPYQKHGSLSGFVRRVSEGSMQNGEGKNAETVFRTRINIGSTDKLKNLPPNFRLMPGMNVVAEMKIGERRVIDYFLYPLFRHLDNSIREP